MERKQRILEDCIDFILTFNEPISRIELARRFHEIKKISASDNYINNNTHKFLSFLTSSNKYSVEQKAQFLHVTSTKLTEDYKELHREIKEGGQATWNDQMQIISFQDNDGNVKFDHDPTDFVKKMRKNTRKPVSSSLLEMLNSCVKFVLEFPSETPVSKQNLSKRFLNKTGYNKSKTFIFNNVKNFLELFSSTEDYSGEQKARFLYLTSIEVTEEYKELKNEIEKSGRVKWNDKGQIVRYAGKNGKIKFQGVHIIRNTPGEENRKEESDEDEENVAPIKTGSKQKTVGDSEFEDTDSELNFKPEFKKPIQKKRKIEDVENRAGSRKKVSQKESDESDDDDQKHQKNMKPRKRGMETL